MHRGGNDLNQAMRRQRAGGASDGQQGAQGSPAATVMSLTQQVADGTLQQQQTSPTVATSQLQHSPLQHYIMTGQVQNITQASQQRPQILAHIQGLRVPVTAQSAATLSLAASPTAHTLTPQALGRLYAPAAQSSVPQASTGGAPGSGGGAASTLHRQLSSPGGMMVVPPVSPSRGLQLSAVTTPPSGQQQQLGIVTMATNVAQTATASGPTTIIVQQQQPQQAVTAATESRPAVSTVSASGGTIHHLGQSPSRGGIPPLVNPLHQQQRIITSMNVQQIQQALQQQQQQQLVQGLLTSGTPPSPASQQAVRRNSGSPAASPRAHVLTNPLLTFGNQGPPRSPVQSPERPRKRVKLEEKPAPNLEIAQYRRLICDQKQKELQELKENYSEHLTEIFFLQNMGNIMDYHQWKKRPTIQLINFLKSGNLDSDEEEEVEQEKKINDEVKVRTVVGGTTPLATPVAISTTLPPAVSAIQQQGNTLEPGKKLGGRHGMVFGHVQQPPAQVAPQTPPAMPGGVPLVASLSTTVATIAQCTSTKSVTTTVAPRTITSTIPASASTQSSGTSTSTTNTASNSHSNQLAKMMSETAPTNAQPKTTSATTTTATSVTSVLSGGTPKMQSKSPTVTGVPRLGTRQHSISALYDTSLGSQEAIVERAKQEAQVMQRIGELRKEGLWSARRLPKVQEPPRQKAHWDYLLEEMQWLAADFTQERKWKKAGARKIARMITRYHQELQQKEIRAEKEEAQKLKRIASNLAKMVKEFWNNIEKVVQYKQQSRLDEKKKKAMDIHLSFIVDQTEKYSSWLTEGLGTVQGSKSVASSIPTSPSHSSVPDDGDFEPNQNDTDDEETIAIAEEELDEGADQTQEEIDALQKESEIPIEELLKSLPKEILEKPASLDASDASGAEDDGNESKSKDKEFKADEEEEEDLEETIAEQEKHERKAEHKKELMDLEAENEMSVDELRKKYADAYDPEFESQLSMDESETEDESESEEEEEEEESAEEEEEEDEEEDDGETEMEVGMDYLLTNKPEIEEANLQYQKQQQQQAATLKQSVKAESKEEGPGSELTDIAATAMSLQPTGYTLETTQVQTKVPFLLKHTLREYQHVGLDWLATMHERRLNGILADEMGLGKTIQTIAVLAHLACENGVWGPHLIVVPTSVMLNWEMEFKKWCPAFKILTYYGSQKERKQKRHGWTKTNAFHVCITSYKLVIQDHQAFRRKKWKYFILDEAQNIKNFKSQRWQMLLNFQSQRRLLLTGTPLQNSLMELWSLMHFLMPHVFASHRDFKEWFSNPLTGMIEGSREYNENLIKRLHKVLRPFLLRRLKQDVEKQMPKKYEHVVMCRLSKRQRFLYDDFMSQAKTKETLATGHFMSVINILMQLRKVCNHPNLFDPRPIVSSFQMEGISYTAASVVLRALYKDPLESISVTDLHPCLADLELSLPAFAAHRIRKLQTGKPLIEEIDSQPEPPPRLKPLQKPQKLVFRSVSPLVQPGSGRSSPAVPIQQRAASPLVKPQAVVPGRAATPTSTADNASRVHPTGSSETTATCSPLPTHAKIPAQNPSAFAIVSQAASTDSPSSSASTLATATPTTSSVQQLVTSQPITVQIHHTQQGTRLMIPSGQLSQLPAGFIQIVQTSSGQQIIAAAPSQASTVQQVSLPVVNGPALVTTAGQVAATTLSSRPTMVQLPTTTTVSSGKPVGRVPPLAQPAQPAQPAAKQQLATKPPSPGTSLITSSSTRPLMATRLASRATTLLDQQANKKSPLYMESLVEKRAQRRKEKLERLARMNKTCCDVKPVYGQDLCEAVNILRPESTATNMKRDCDTTWRMGQGYVHCERVHRARNPYHPSVFWHQTDPLRQIVHTPQQYLSELKDMLERYTFYVPVATAPRITMHTSHPPPSLLNEQRRMQYVVHHELSPKAESLHFIASRNHVQFPEARLIQYDCGKLQTMDLLLRRLKSGDHRVLIFTQMTKMLDVLEAFLNYHGHRYLRLDGTTKVEQRQILMERFNNDRRIFCFILSTRSGGLGVNLTGADTVIFYDSDWNPTMDAQAQDRCHRIGQTRDVHIYRLISEKTVEENILKKANQKRLLGNVAIEGGNFTTAFFQQGTIQELFEEPSGLQGLAKETQAKENEARERREKEAQAAAAAKAKMTQDQIEQALCQAEDETDVQAAKVVHAEQKAELAEFDEEIPWDEKEEAAKKERQEEMSKVEQELTMIEKELTPVERYAVLFVEHEMKPVTLEELEAAEEEVSIAKEEWELSRLQALKEEEERRAELEEDEMLFTYSRDDAYSQVKKKSKKSQQVAAKPSRSSSRRAVVSIDESVEIKEEKEVSKAPSRVLSRRSSIASTGSNGSFASSVSAEKLRSPKEDMRVGKGRGKHHSYEEDEDYQPDMKVASPSRGIAVLTRGRRVSGNAVVGRKAKRRVSDGDGPNPSPKVRALAAKSLAAAKRNISTPKVGRPRNPFPKVATPKLALGSPKSSSTPKPTPKSIKPKQSPKTPVTSPILQPWSNPNLVIRTRRASAKSGPEECKSNGTVVTTAASVSSPPKCRPNNAHLHTVPILSRLSNPQSHIAQAAAKAGTPILTQVAAMAKDGGIGLFTNNPPVSSVGATSSVVASIGGKHIIRPSQPVYASSSKPSLLTSGASVLLTSSQLAQSAAGTVVMNNNRVNNTVPILEKLAMQFAVTSSPQQVTQVLQTKPTTQMIPSKQTVAQLVAARPGGSGVSQMVARPTVSQIITRPAGGLQMMQGARPLFAQIVQRPGTQIIQGKPGIQYITTKQGIAQVVQGRQVIQGQIAQGQVIQGQQVTRIVQGKPNILQGKAITQMIQGKPVTQIIQGKPGTQIVHRPVTQLIQGKPVTQILQQGKQVVTGRPTVAQLISQPGTKQTMAQLIQGKQTLSQVMAGRQQYVVVSSADKSNPRSRVVILQQPQQLQTQPSEATVVPAAAAQVTVQASNGTNTG